MATIAQRLLGRLPAASPAPARRLPLRRLVVLGLASALVLGGALYAVARTQADEALLASFREASAERAWHLEKDVLALGGVVRSLRDFFRSSEIVTREEFQTFAAGPLARTPAVRAVAWVPALGEAERRASAARARAEGIEAFAVQTTVGTPETEGRLSFPVVFAAPAVGCEFAPGRELGSEPAFMRARAVADQTDTPVLTDPVPCGGRMRTLMVHAVRVAGVRAPAGYVVLAFSPRDVLAGVLSADAAPLMEVELTDEDVPGATRVLYASPGFAAGDRAASDHPIEAGSQTWHLRATPTAAFLARHRTSHPLLVGLTTALIWSLLLATAIALGWRARRRAFQRQDRTIRAVLASLDEGVIVTDVRGRMLLCNAAARRILDLEVEEDDLPDVGLTWFGRVTAAPVPQGREALECALRGESVEETEVQIGGAGRSGRWLAVSAAPLRDDGQEVTGALLVLRDVTARHTADQAVRRLEVQRVEMDLAGDVQRKLYPVAAPPLRGFQLSGAVFSAEATCGDYFDFLELPGNRLAIAIGDVSGHGLGPALVMTQVRTHLRSFMQMTDDLSEVFARLNEALTADLEDGFFVTLLVAVLDLDTRRIHYANAGHIPTYVLGGDGQVKAKLTGTGMALGLFEESRHTIGGGFVLEPGDVAVFLTDGVTESRGDTGPLLGEEGAIDVARQHVGATPDEIVRRIYERVQLQAGTRPQDDDVTMVVLKALAPSAAPTRAPTRLPALASAPARSTRSVRQAP